MAGVFVRVGHAAVAKLTKKNYIVVFYHDEDMQCTCLEAENAADAVAKYKAMYYHNPDIEYEVYEQVKLA